VRQRQPACCSRNGGVLLRSLALAASSPRRAQRDDGLWEITGQFAASPNVTGLSVGDITGIDKKGWEYLWVLYQDTEDTSAAALVKRPVAAYVERVYDSGNFGSLVVA